MKMINFFKCLNLAGILSLQMVIAENEIPKTNQFSLNQKIDLLCAKAPAVPEKNMPAYDWWNECLHGVARAGKATVFPKPIALGCMWDTELLLKITDAISDEARAKYHQALRQKGHSDRYEGLTFFSPTLNIARDPRWGRFSAQNLQEKQFFTSFSHSYQNL